MELLIETPDGFSLGIVQIAGRLARRIVCYPGKGDPVVKGKRFGLIRFGSRVELFLPQEVSVSVRPGQNVKGGETVMGYFP
jgi:phosphatidylserine decarboxylase